MKPRKLEIRDSTKYKDNELILSHLEDSGKCHIMTASYGGVTSCCITLSQARKARDWLNRWIKYKEGGE